MKKDTSILIIDIETTGFSKSNNKILEIGMVELNLETKEKKIVFDSVLYEEGMTKSELINCWLFENKFIKMDDFKGARTLEVLRGNIQKVIDLYPNGATAFNSSFDFGFLEHRGFKFPRKLDCPMKLSTNVCKIPKKSGNGFKWPNVEEAHKYFFGDVGYIEKHRGADDAFHEADIVQALYDRGIFKI